MRTLSSLYKEYSKKPTHLIDPYKVVVINLIGLVDRRDIANSAIPQVNFDDFLWANVWFIHMSRLLSRAGLVEPPPFHSPFAMKSSSQSALKQQQQSKGLIGSDMQSLEGEHDFLELIYAFGGAEYFDEQRNSPIKFALLLMACHRFGDAIVYLWQADKVFYAAHLLVLCLFYGLVLPHNALHCNPEHPLVSR